MSWGDSFTSILRAGTDLRDRYERRKMDKADAELRKELTSRPKPAATISAAWRRRGGRGCRKPGMNTDSRK